MSEQATSAMFAQPSWLRASFDHPIPDDWQALGATFVRLAGVLLAHEPPVWAVVECVDAGDHLGIQIQSAAPDSKLEIQVLRDIADRLAALSYACRPADRNDLSGIRSGTLVAHETISEALNREAASDHGSSAADQLPLDLVSEEEVDPATVRVFKWHATEQDEEARAGTRHAETAVRIRRTQDRLERTGNTRRYVGPPPDWQSRLSEFERDFPNFGAVIAAVVRPHLALVGIGIKHRMPPVLLAGPPGVGKTHFARALHRVLGVPPPLLISMAGESNGSAIAGSSTFWSNSMPGQAFELLAWGHRGEPAIANPIIVLDEVDKVSARDCNPLGGLYSLLEAETAKEFQDQALPDLLIDASLMRVVLTANDSNAVPAPLRSRMLTFEIDAPTEKQLDSIATGIYESLLEKLALGLTGALPEGILRAARTMSPREVKIILESAIGYAVLAGRGHLTVEDWQCVAARAKSPCGPRIGFNRQH